MPRAIWTGSISFGLVSIPVGLFSATEDHTIHFHQFERGTADRIRYVRVNERTGKEVEYSDIVKGKEVGGGDYVIVEPEELADIAPGRSRTIDIVTFVDLDEIDPIFFQKTYWLGPTAEQYSRPYALLREAMDRSNRAGIATFVMRGKEYLTAIRADDDVLALETMFFADEIRDPAKLDDLPGTTQAKGRELEMATSLIESMSGPWRPRNYRDAYQERVQKLIEDKRAGREIVTEAEPAEATEMSGLLAALERSVAAAKDRSKGTKPASKNGASKGGASKNGASKGGASKNGASKGGASKGGASKGGAGRGKQPDLADANKTELLKLARKHDIPGRSSMSREELAEAIRAAEGSARQAS
jgi:DNA end-binding protein Ku